MMMMPNSSRCRSFSVRRSPGAVTVESVDAELFSAGPLAAQNS
jgi:hypothetical protein